MGVAQSEHGMSERTLVFHAEAKDFRVDTYRGTGPGGQHRNKTDSCVRITHLESGLVASCCQHRSQTRNKREAFRKLAPLLIARYVPARTKERQASGTVVVRTYHAVDNRVKDHESGVVQSYDIVLDDPAVMIRSRAAAITEQRP
jgi:protein subunit release factor A